MASAGLGPAKDTLPSFSDRRTFLSPLHYVLLSLPSSHCIHQLVPLSLSSIAYAPLISLSSHAQLGLTRLARIGQYLQAPLRHPSLLSAVTPTKGGVAYGLASMRRRQQRPADTRKRPAHGPLALFIDQRFRVKTSWRRRQHGHEQQYGMLESSIGLDNDLLTVAWHSRLAGSSSGSGGACWKGAGERRRRVKTMGSGVMSSTAGCSNKNGEFDVNRQCELGNTFKDSPCTISASTLDIVGLLARRGGWMVDYGDEQQRENSPGRRLSLRRSVVGNPVGNSAVALNELGKTRQGMANRGERRAGLPKCGDDEKRGEGERGMMMVESHESVTFLYQSTNPIISALSFSPYERPLQDPIDDMNSNANVKSILSNAPSIPKISHLTVHAKV
ncbi:hypothetical protein NLJ89_g7281 [Agrocybe chaxingu]|uniref:Uncharacterized protein n=1 Tax=Agrocybe chaxingu TaxID=84603 RepID=A0A9W8MT97_9AGAR|nr:hypothetical protein NLJ89_g7281 [Agrocybe chaxingu]